jgi:hypothetical protein
MAERFWVNTETMAASHKAGGGTDAQAMRLRLCRQLIRATQMSEREVQEMALRAATPS